MGKKMLQKYMHLAWDISYSFTVKEGWNDEPPGTTRPDHELPGHQLHAAGKIRSPNFFSFHFHFNFKFKFCFLVKRINISWICRKESKWWTWLKVQLMQLRPLWGWTMLIILPMPPTLTPWPAQTIQATHLLRRGLQPEVSTEASLLCLRSS